MEFINGRPGPYPEFGAPEGLVRGADREGPIFPRTPWPSIGATYIATLGIVAALRARQVSGLGQHVTTSLLQGALAAACLNWQRVEDPDAPLYWMWPVDSRSIEGLFECADGKWVHHWTLRPRWVLAAAEGDTLSAVGLDTSFRDDPDRVSMESDGLLAGIFLHPQLVEAFKKFPADGVGRGGRGSGTWDHHGQVAERRHWRTSRFSPMVAWSRSTIPEEGLIRHVGPLLEFSATPGSVPDQRPAPASIRRRCSPQSNPSVRTPRSRLGASGAARPSAGRHSGPRSGSGCGGAVHGASPCRPRSRRHQDQRAARHLLEWHAHGSRHEPREAQHRPQSQGSCRPGGAGEVAAAL